MKLKTLLAAVIAALVGSPKQTGKIVGRMRFADSYMAFKFRMGAGFPGDVNRTHPAEIEATLMNVDDPVKAYGNVGIVDTATNAIRGVVAADQHDTTTLTPFGALVRPYPTQQSSGSNFGAAAFGSATPPLSGVVDFCRSGLIMVQLNAGVTDPTKGGGVWVWAAATSGDHTQGGYETEASAGNTVKLDPRFYSYNGPPDENGVAELSCNV